MECNYCCLSVDEEMQAIQQDASVEDRLKLEQMDYLLSRLQTQTEAINRTTDEIKSLATELRNKLVNTILEKH